MPSSHLTRACFRRCGAYSAFLPPAPAVRERPAREWSAAPPTERHVQCVWFDAAYRPSGLVTAEGEPVTVDDPGTWNLEPGPDFLDATLRIAGARGRVLKGDVEVHLRPGDWKQHRHAADPRYARVVAHVCYWPGTLPPAGLPQGAVQFSLREPLAASHAFAFDALDVTAYPYPPRAESPPCARAFAALGPDGAARILEAAGEQRLRLKAERMTAAMAERDPDQILYEEVMAALGFKQNRQPFRLLARKVPVQTLRLYAKGDPVKAHALLAGVAGLLPARLDSRWDEETRTFVRHLWDLWWKQRGQWENVSLPRKAWTFAGVRPPNHPLRRLMAAAQLFCGRVALPARLLAAADADPDTALGKLLGLFECASPDLYWPLRTSLGSPRRETPVALVGSGRAAAIVTNVLVPHLAATGQIGAHNRGILNALPPEDDNLLVRRTATLLFGRDHNPDLYRTGLRQQGLIQIFHDFCLTDRTRCAKCPLPAAVSGAESDAPRARA